MNTAQTAENLGDESHDEPPWLLRFAFQFLVLALVAAEVALTAAVYHRWIWLAVPLVLLTSHLMHGALIGLHEATHGMLRTNRTLNEIDGVLIGTLSFMSFSLYRAIHQTHHAHLSTERDFEMWPLAERATPLWARRLAAFLELNFGMFFTPLLFLRAFLCKDSPMRSKRMRRRVWAEFLLIVVVWAAVISGVAVFGLWKYFFWVYLAPAFLAGNLQSWRKYIEHIGLTGTTVNGSTRSIVADSWSGRLCALTLLHEPFHGIHHLRAGLPHSALPRHAAQLAPKAPGERPPFGSYREAFIDVVRGLADPRVGPQWQNVERSA